MEIYYIDGRFVSADQAVIPVNDLALLRGFGVFDLMRTYGGRPYFLDAHIKRLMRSAEHIGLVLPWSHETLCRKVLETLERNTLKEANIRIVVTGGPSPDFSTPQGRPRLLILVNPAPELPEQWYRQGVKIISFRTQRFIPDAKSINYIPATIAMQQARECNAVEAVYVDREDRVLEGTTSNLFAVIADELVTPGEHILKGITRQEILDLCDDLVPVVLREIAFGELLTAREVFITGSNKGLVPVVQVDEHVIGNGRPGRLTQRLMARLKDHRRQFASEDTATADE
jgi:branched-chain amino acid aminotransferase